MSGNHLKKLDGDLFKVMDRPLRKGNIYIASVSGKKQKKSIT